MSHWQFQPLTDVAPLQGPQEMACPQCSRPMTKGSVALDYTWWGFFLAGWSVLTLFFRAPGRERLSIVGTTDTKDAFRCDSCGTVVLVGEGAADTPCLSCSAVIPAGTTTCPKCSWSYEPSLRTPDNQ